MRMFSKSSGYIGLYTLKWGGSGVFNVLRSLPIWKIIFLNKSLKSDDATCLNVVLMPGTHRYAAFPSSSSLLLPLEPLFFPHILLVMHINNPHCRIKKQLTSVTTRISNRAATPRPITAPSPRPLKSVSEQIT